jgi:transaldolase
VRVNVTLIFQPLQALLAAKAGAAFVSPFLGRLDDIGHEGIEIIPKIREIFDHYGFECLILAASLRHPLHVLQVALAGADCATIPYAVFKRLIHHPLTEEGLARFLKDYYAVFKEK